MKCAMCGRPLTLPTASVPTRAGPMAYGPVCAKRAGLVRPAERRQRVITFSKPPKPDARQLDWVAEAAR